MSLKEEILKKIPERLRREPEVKCLLEKIKEKKIKEKEELLKSLRKEIKEAEKWLKEKKEGGTTVKIRRDKVMKLSVLKKCEKLVKDYLI